MGKLFNGLKDLNIWDLINSDCGDKYDRRDFAMRWIDEKGYSVSSQILIEDLIEEYEKEWDDSDFECFFDWLEENEYIEKRKIVLDAEAGIEIDAIKLNDFVYDFGHDMTGYPEILKFFEQKIKGVESVKVVPKKPVPKKTAKKATVPKKTSKSI